MKHSDDDGNDAAASVFSVWVVRPFDLHPHLFPNLQEHLLLLSGRNTDQLIVLWQAGAELQEDRAEKVLPQMANGSSADFWTWSDTTTHGSLTKAPRWTLELWLLKWSLPACCFSVAVITELRARRSLPVIRHQPDSGAQYVRPLHPDSCSYKL